jgi:hypothetical protein
MLVETRYTQTGSGAGAGILSSDVKWPGREADHVSPSSARVKKECMLTSIASVDLQDLHRRIF